MKKSRELREARENYKQQQVPAYELCQVQRCLMSVKNAKLANHLIFKLINIFSSSKLCRYTMFKMDLYG